MSRESSRSRRGVLGAIGGATAVAVSGCLSGGGGGETTTAASKTVVVGPDGEFEFDPKSITVAVGEAVTWRWDSDTHNIVVDGQPEGADWAGTAGGPSKTYASGHEYTHTFEVAGTYTYYCNPHKGLGMTGEVVVKES